MQVKADAMDKVRRRTGSNGTLMVSRNELHSLARESHVYGDGKATYGEMELD